MFTYVKVKVSWHLCSVATHFFMCHTSYQHVKSLPLGVMCDVCVCVCVKMNKGYTVGTAEPDYGLWSQRENFRLCNRILKVVTLGSLMLIGLPRAGVLGELISISSWLLPVQPD